MLCVILLSIIGGLISLFVGESISKYYSKLLSLWVSVIVWLLSIVVWYVCIIEGWEEVWFNGSVRFVVDGKSVYFISLTGFLILISMVSLWDKKGMESSMGLFLILEGFTLGVFSVYNVLWFYVCFEGVLVPMYLIVLIWGSRERKVKAGNYLFVYTLFGSLFMLVGIVLMYNGVGSLDYEVISNVSMSIERELLIWLLFFIGFMVKVPMVPLHIWLAEAHVEAPTEGSVILAGVLLKLGGYGLIRFSVDLLKMGSMYFVDLVNVLGLIGVIYTGLTAIRQTDIKRVIAYASVGHMSLTVLGLFSGVIEGYNGSILQMISHGIVSGGLFLCIGMLYDRLHSRQIYYLSGIVRMMPKFGVVFFILIMGNIGLPGTCSFVGEFLILEGIFSVNKFIGIMSSLNMVFGGCYSLWLFNRIMFGNSKEGVVVEDLSRKEIWMILPIIYLVFLIGIKPEICLSVIEGN